MVQGYLTPRPDYTFGDPATGKGRDAQPSILKKLPFSTPSTYTQDGTTYQKVPGVDPVVGKGTAPTTDPATWPKNEQPAAQATTAYSPIRPLTYGNTAEEQASADFWLDYQRKKEAADNYIASMQQQAAIAQQNFGPTWQKMVDRARAMMVDQGLMSSTTAGSVVRDADAQAIGQLQALLKPYQDNAANAAADVSALGEQSADRIRARADEISAQRNAELLNWAQFDEAVNQFRTGQGNWEQTFAYQMQRDAVGDKQTADQFAFAKQQYEQAVRDGDEARRDAVLQTLTSTMLAKWGITGTVDASSMNRLMRLTEQSLRGVGFNLRQGDGKGKLYQWAKAQDMKKDANSVSRDSMLREDADRDRSFTEAVRQYEDGKKSAASPDDGLWSWIIEAATTNKMTDIDPDTPGIQRALFPTDILSMAKAQGLDIETLAKKGDTRALGLLDLMYDTDKWKAKYLGENVQPTVSVASPTWRSVHADQVDAPRAPQSNLGNIADAVGTTMGESLRQSPVGTYGGLLQAGADYLGSPQGEGGEQYQSALRRFGQSWNPLNIPANAVNSFSRFLSRLSD